MKCPYCNYINGWDPDCYVSIKEESGGFYKLPVEMGRVESHGYERTIVYGCPLCGKVFMEI